MPTLDVLYEDNHLLVINKPAEIATMGAESGVLTVHQLAADYLKSKYNKPGRAYVGIVSRLDAMTSGVLVLARTSKAASRLSQQFAGENRPTKIYLAAVEGHLAESQGTMIDMVRKDDTARRMRVVSETASGAQSAELRYVTVGRDDEHALIAVQLVTGRKHQIRVQFADRGYPLLGDRKYGSRVSFPVGVALHSWRLQIMHPVQRKPIWLEAELPASWKRLRKIVPPSEELRGKVQKTFDLDE